MKVLKAAVASIVLGAGVVLLMLTPTPAQTPEARAPRMPDGKPDLNGIWQAFNEANWDIEAHNAAPSPILVAGATGATPPGMGIVEGGTIPYKESALEKKKENNKNRISLDPEVKCYLPGVPRATYMPQPFQILQTSKEIVIAYQYAGAVRNIHMTDPGPAPSDSWMGTSVGRWDGNTLVVDVTAQNDQTWFDRAGNFHSDALHVVERYTPMGPNHILYEATIEDPNVFTQPWKISLPLYRRMEKNARLMEFKCVEFVEELMYGHLRKQTAK
jgi:hypothetical protein